MLLRFTVREFDFFEQSAGPIRILRLAATARRYCGNDQHMMCSVIIPVFNERDNVSATHEVLTAVAEAERSLDWEFLLVEDGSTDDTFAVLTDINRGPPHVNIRKSRPIDQPGWELV
jgi:cellulose synthase/poly-beta-1,6-N-acetylglucosamine synthase-like glycosyltransferase